MALATDLMGLGMAPGLSNLIGQPTQTITATGTAVGTAAQMLSDTGVALVNAQSSQTGVQLPSNAPINDPIYVWGTGAVAPVVYAPTGHTINNAASSVTLSGAQAGGLFMRVSLTQWRTIPLAP